MRSGSIRVIVVDDSPTILKMLTKMFASDSEIEVVCTALDPYEARDRIKEFNPDVLILDLELPKMDGLTFLKIIMKQRPMPVIIFSSLSRRGTAVALEALRSGAFDVFGKPENLARLTKIHTQLCMKVKEAGWAVRNDTWQHRIESNKTASPFNLQQNSHFTRIPWEEPPSLRPNHLLLIGASTGGTEAVSRMLSKLPPQVPPILVAQHIPKNFSHSFAMRLEAECAVSAKEAEDGEIAKHGCIYVAPGGQHLTAKWTGMHYRLSLNEDPPIWHQRPAVDVLFESVLDSAGPHVVATLLTGMGRDGANGLKALRDKGARCFAQNEESCVVFGMPRAAQELKAPEKMVDIRDMANTVLQAFKDSFKSPRSALNRTRLAFDKEGLVRSNAKSAAQRSTRSPVSRNLPE